MHEMSSVKQKILMSAFECSALIHLVPVYSKTETFVGLVQQQFSLV